MHTCLNWALQMEFKGQIASLQLTLDKQQLLTLRLTDDITAQYDELIDKDLDISIKIHREKRSLNANSFLWVLCNELGNKLRMSKEEVYLNCLRSYGQSEIVSVISTANVKGIFKYYDELGQGEVNGKTFTHYKVYKGSSEYDTVEMSILLDGVVEEAKLQGIQVLTASEIDLLKREWGN